MNLHRGKHNAIVDELLRYLSQLIGIYIKELESLMFML